MGKTQRGDCSKYVARFRRDYLKRNLAFAKKRLVAAGGRVDGLSRMRVVRTEMGLSLWDESTSVPLISRLTDDDPLSFKNRDLNPERALAFEAAAHLQAALQAEDDPEEMAAIDEVAKVYADALFGDMVALRKVKELQAQQAAMRVSQASNAGKARKGKLSPVTQLVRRALVYDAETVDGGKRDWHNDAQQRRTVKEALKLLANEEVVSEITAALPALRVTELDVGKEADGKLRATINGKSCLPVSRRTLENLPARLKKMGLLR